MSVSISKEIPVIGAYSIVRALADHVRQWGGYPSSILIRIGSKLSDKEQEWFDIDLDFLRGAEVKIKLSLLDLQLEEKLQKEDPEYNLLSKGVAQHELRRAPARLELIYNVPY